MSITAVPGILVGHASDPEARTGCTVVLGPFRGACDVRGSASGSRELETLSPLHPSPTVDALLLTGGSAFGLAAATGVVRWLEAHGLGYPTGITRVPLVPAAVIFDLAVGRMDRRPDDAMGWAACEAAGDGDVEEGAVGVGTGATVGKILGLKGAMRGGVGSWSLSTGDWTVGALVVANPLGDVLDGRGGVLAGARDDSGRMIDSAELLRRGKGDLPDRLAAARPGTNTTIAIVATDAPLSRTALQVLSRAGAAGVARRVSPVNTLFDGDITFAVSTSAREFDVAPAEQLRLGAMAAFAVEMAIARAVTVGL